jgi:hypothetical protein
MNYGSSMSSPAVLLANMDNDFGGFKPTAATLAFGNGVDWRRYTPEIGKAVVDTMRQVLARLSTAGATAIIASPAAPDVRDYRTVRGFAASPAAAQAYTDSLRQQGDLAHQLATETNTPFVDLYYPLLPLIDKAANIRESAGGHLAMAYGFLKAMGFDGDMGTIAMDMKGEATASGGHRVLAAQTGVVEIESSRWPFCFLEGQGILPYLPFNQDLNRLTLTVGNLATEQAQVTWGEQSRIFSRADLEKGINLAAEFLDNPFLQPFQKLEDAVYQKQGYEIFMMRYTISPYPQTLSMIKDDPLLTAKAEALNAQLWAHQAKLAERVRALVTPIKHSLTIAPLPER